MSINEEIPEPPKPNNIALMKLMEMRNELKKQRSPNTTQHPQSLPLEQKSPFTPFIVDSVQKVTPTKKELLKKRPQLPQQKTQDIQILINKSSRDRVHESKNESEEDNLDTSRRTETPKFGWKQEEKLDEQRQTVSAFNSEMPSQQKKHGNELDQKNQQDMQQFISKQEKLDHQKNNNQEEHHSDDEKQDYANSKDVGKQLQLQVIPEIEERPEKQDKRNQQIVNNSRDKDIDIGVYLNKPSKSSQHTNNNAVETVVSIDSVHEERKKQKKMHKILLKEHLVVKETNKNLAQALRGLQYIRTKIDTNPLAKSHIRETLKLISKLFEQK